MRLLVVLSVAPLALSLAAPAAAEDGTCALPYGPPEAVGTVEAGELVEASGLAFSREVPGRLYSHNDSGDGPRLFLLDEAGALEAEVELAGMVAVDWEDVAVGPCPAAWPERSCVFVADIGDNAAARAELLLHVLPEPPEGGGPASVSDYLTVPVAYPDGPRDAESLVVTPEGRPAILGKDATGAELYLFPERWPAEALDPPVVPELVATLDLAALGAGLPVATAADLSPEGARLAVRTYGSVVVLQQGERRPLVELVEEGSADTLPGPPEIQGEAVAWHPERPELWTVSEGESPRLYRARCPDGAWTPLPPVEPPDEEDPADGDPPPADTTCQGCAQGPGGGASPGWLAALLLLGGLRGRR